MSVEVGPRSKALNPVKLPNMNWRDFIEEKIKLVKENNWFMFKKERDMNRASRPRAKENIFNKDMKGI